MSFFSTLKTDFEKIEAIFIAFFKKEPTWAQVAETDIAYAAPLVNTIITLVAGPAVDADVQAVITDIQNDLVLATKFIQAEDASSNLTDVLNNLVANLQGLLTLAGVKSSSSINEITAYVTGIVGEINAILNALPKNAVAPTR